ncbi:MAG: SAM-dependent chlorinase/fluorinase [Proteobacteria bacterium]|nr:SAM-dependent chlorinase/fluorinase [Pseudomonadota bacterium]MBU1641412.1 SAM-dependent chlorinase/fluorinase [Pseudomonadota bacterium]
MLITLTTDFGLDDPFVAMMKGVILSRCPQACLVDICHTIPPHDVSAAGHILAEAAPYFPKATIHVAVVDPGVGTDRRIICIDSGGHLMLAPDNGLLTPFFDDAYSAFQVMNDDLFLQPLSATFHGRDIFAPVAAALACGLDPRELGPSLPLGDLVRLVRPMPTMHGQELRGQCLHADHFGNMATNISQQDLATFLAPGETPMICLAETTITDLSRTFDKKPGSAIALLNSSNHLEISIPRGNAARELNLLPGTLVVVRKTGAPKI